MQTLKKIFSVILRVGMSIALLLFLFRNVDKKSLFTIVKNSDKTLLLLAFCIFASGYVFCLLRWEMLLRAVKIQLPLKRIIISFCGGIFFSLFLPSTIGGDFMRSIDLSAHTKKPKEVVATVLLDRLSGYTGLVSLALLSFVIGWRFVQDRSVLLSVALITFVLAAALLALFNKFAYTKINQLLHSPGAGKIRESIKNLHQEIHYFKHQKKAIIKNLALSLIIQSTAPLSFFVIALSLGLKIKLLYFFIFLPIISAVTLLPISIGGLGLRDATTIFFFAKVGVVKNLSFAMSLINFFFILVCGCLGGLIYVLTLRHRRIQHHKPSAVQARP